MNVSVENVVQVSGVVALYFAVDTSSEADLGPRDGFLKITN